MTETDLLVCRLELSVGGSLGDAKGCVVVLSHLGFGFGVVLRD